MVTYLYEDADTADASFRTAVDGLSAAGCKLLLEAMGVDAGDRLYACPGVGIVRVTIDPPSPESADQFGVTVQALHKERSESG